MVAYAVYLVYRSERLKKVLEAGADTIKYQNSATFYFFQMVFSHLIFCLRTLSNLNLKPGSSLVALGHSVRRKTMDRLSSKLGVPSGETGMRRGTPSLRQRKGISFKTVFQEGQGGGRIPCE